MNINDPLLKHSIQFGIALGVTLTVIELITLFLGIIVEPYMQLVNISIIVSMLIIALRKYRDQIQNGLLSFADGFKVSFFICLISGAIWAIYRLIEYSLVPELIDEMLIILEDAFMERHMPEDQIEAIMKLYEIGLTPPVLALTTLIFNMGFGGALLSLALASAFKKEIKNT